MRHCDEKKRRGDSPKKEENPAQIDEFWKKLGIWNWMCLKKKEGGWDIYYRHYFFFPLKNLLCFAEDTRTNHIGGRYT